MGYFCWQSAVVVAVEKDERFEDKRRLLWLEVRLAHLSDWYNNIYEIYGLLAFGNRVHWYVWLWFQREVRVQTSPILFLARYRNFLSYSFRLSLSSLAASTLAGESRLGSTSIEVTLIKTASMVNTGFHFSDNFYIGFIGSSTGGWRIEMQTSPFL